MKTSTLFGLIACNLIWSAHPAMAKLALAEVSPTTVAWCRYTLTFLAYAIAAAALGASFDQSYARTSRRRDMGWMMILGFMSFCFSPLTQMTGLSHTRATDNSLIIAMEPMITVLLARIFLGERLNRAQFMAFGVALLGFGLLSGIASEGGGLALGAHFVANLLLFVSLTGEATHSVLSRKLVQRYSPMRVFGTSSFLGAVFLTISVVILAGPGFVAELSQLSWKGWFGLLWLGPLGTTATYLYWMYALTQVPVASVVLTLFIQPLCGAIWGYAFLDDRLTALQAAGGVLILVAVFFESGRHLTRRASLLKEST